MLSTYRIAPHNLLNYIPVPESGCWLWLGSWGQGGYGDVQCLDGDKRNVKAHRAFYANYVGPIPKGMLVCHKCDTRACVNPGHLFLGTHKDNMEDCCRKGRIYRTPSLESPSTKLTEDQVRAIRASTEQQRVLARRYGVSDYTIRVIRTGKTWRNLT